MARGDSLARQLDLMDILQSRGQLLVSEVARELGFATRTLYRDLQVLERVGVPIYQDRRGRRTRWRVVEGYRRRLSVTLSWTEALAMLAGRALLAASSGSPLDEAAGDAVRKMQAALPVELVARAAAASLALTASGGPTHDYRDRAEALRRVVEALEKSESIQVEYRKPGSRRAERRLVDPYHLHLQGGALYLLAWDRGRREVRTFLADRILGVRGTGRPFIRDSGFVAGRLVHGAFGPWAGRPAAVALRFDRRSAAYAAGQRMHGSQTNQWRDDGSLDVVLRVPIGPQIVAWILGWGARVRVVAPKRLAEAVRLEHARAARVPP